MVRLSRRSLLSLVGFAVIPVSGCLDESDPNGVQNEPTSTDAEPANDRNDQPAETDEGDETNELSGRWRLETVEDVTTGETFTIEELEQPVFVHTFAIWCGVCQRQHGEFGSLIDQTTGEFTVLELNIDPSEDPDAVRRHVEQNDFDWAFAVPPTQMTEALVDDFGSTVVSPPLSPVILVCPEGEIHVLDKVIGASDLETAMEERCPT